MFKRKVTTQILLYVFELLLISGMLTYISFRLVDAGAHDAVLVGIERFILFYGVYQILTIVILNTVNDIKADEYLALRTAAGLALLAVKAEDNELESYVLSRLNAQKQPRMMNDDTVKARYSRIAEYLKTKDITNLEKEEILADHQYETSKLGWRYSFVLRVLK